MPSLELDPASGRYRVRFRYEGREFKRSLRTRNVRVAQATLRRVEETLRMLEPGMASVPSGAEEAEVARLYEQIGRLKVELDWLKKKSLEFDGD